MRTTTHRLRAMRRRVVNQLRWFDSLQIVVYARVDLRVGFFFAGSSTASVNSSRFASSPSSTSINISSSPPTASPFFVFSTMSSSRKPSFEKPPSPLTRSF